MVPIGEIFDRLPFVVRDLSRETGKKIRLMVKGQGTELDKYLVERMKDPLLHLVRNAVSHGIEPPAERLALGKPVEGAITVQAYTVSETVVIEVIDDGRGIDATSIAKEGLKKGLVVPSEPNPAEVLELLCTPGFSTRDTADLGAGRGMGMSAVRNTINDLAGEMELLSQPKQGTTFRMSLPLTLAVADALIISAGAQRFAMPQAVVQEITTTEAIGIKQFEQNEIMRHRNTVLPLIRLSSIFGLDTEPRRAYPVLVIGTGLNAVGILADRVIGHREIVVRPMKDPLLKVPGISGATELGDGRAVLILDSLALTQTAKARQKAAGLTTAALSKTL
jgi:two-component system chemotaxis sensor kinase CheA